MIDLKRKLGDIDLDDDENKELAFVPSNGAIERKKADFKPEVFFCGQIVGADDFETTDGLFVEVILKHGTGWKLIDDNPEDNTLQTHTAYPDSEGTFVFAHPF